MRPWFGVLGVTAVALGISLQLEGSPVGSTASVVRSSPAGGAGPDAKAAAGEASQEVAQPGPVSAAQSAGRSKLKLGTISPGGYSVVNVVHVDYREDRGSRARAAGTLFGPLPYRNQANNVAGCDPQTDPQHCCVLPACSFNVDCDDGNPCTTDTCDYASADIGQGLCQGSCLHTPALLLSTGAYEAGECDDGVACNGLETCGADVLCHAGSAPTCCQGGAVPTTCSELAARCTSDALNGACVSGVCVGGVNPGVACANNAGCSGKGALCETNADCGDGTCDRCQPNCFNQSTCEGGPTPGISCTQHSDCGSGGVCHFARSCVGGPTPGASCVADGGCGSIVGVCTTTSKCEGGPTPGATCNPPPATNTCGSGGGCVSTGKCTTGNVGKDCPAAPANGNAVCNENGKCPANRDCYDGLGCNGQEACNTATAGICTAGTCTAGNVGRPCAQNSNCDTNICVASINPCGNGAICYEGKCSLSLTECNVDTDCGAGNFCSKSTQANATQCTTGRCCQVPGSDNAGNCLETKGLGPVTGEPNGCSTIVGSLWYAGDTGEDNSEDAACGGKDTTVTTGVDEWGCPKYGRGIDQHSSSVPPNLLRIVGPISDSPACVKGTFGPNGQWAGPGGTCPDPDGPAGRLFALGDDYAFTNAGPNNHLDVQVVRWVGGVTAGNRISLEFWDSTANFIEDIVLPPLAPDIGINVVVFNPALTIPPSGYLVMRVASDFEPETEFVWLSTDNANGVGTNDANKIWVNAGPVPNAAGGNFLGDGNGILAFEIAGNKIAEPTGACCDKETGTCTNGVKSWICASTNDTYHGNGSTCASVSTDCGQGACCNGADGTCLEKTRAICGGCTAGTCSAGEHSGQSCLTDADCGFLGFGSSCDTDRDLVDGDNAKQSCCPQPASNRCMGGPNNYDLCGAGSPNPAATYCGTCLGVCTRALPTDPVRVCRDNTQCPDGQTCDSHHQDLGTACATDGDCNFGAENGTCPAAGSCSGNAAACAHDSDCPIGQTCDLPTCVGGIRAGQACTTSTDCQGSVCDGSCVSRWSGANDCEDAFIHVISVPAINAPAEVITITGNNFGATSSFPHPDSCYAPTSTNPRAEPGWWEAFSINDCALVRIDMCCSDPIHQPQWAFIVNDCVPADPSADGCQSLIGNAPNPYLPPLHKGARANFRGSPYCPEDNLWQTFGTLPAGTYHHPIYSVLNGVHGPYQVHITVEACPTKACCFLGCTTPAPDPFLACRTDADCTGHGTCDAQCDTVDQIDCTARAGFYLGPPQVVTGVDVCGVNDVACTNFGSCCTGPGICKDHVTGQPLQNMTKALCDAEAGGPGAFVGGVKCEGGVCQGNAACAGESCTTANDCSCSGSTCTAQIDPALALQANPCPICEVQGALNCQMFNGGGFGAASDLSFGTGHTVADDFIHSSGNIDKVCVWGQYFQTDRDVANDYDCGDAVSADKFRVRFYANKTCEGGTEPGTTCTEDADCSGGGATCVSRGRPGPLLAERKVNLPTDATRPRALVQSTSGYFTKVYGYQIDLALDTQSTGPLPSGDTGAGSVTVLEAGECYWIEVVNDTGSTPAFCHWSWARIDPTQSPSRGNDYAYAGDDSSGYISGGEGEWDQAFCLNTNYDAGGCGEQLRPCCDCPGSSCSVISLHDCEAAESKWNVDATACPPTGPACPPEPSNNECADAILVPVGSYAINTECADTDGFNPVVSPLGADFLTDDIWFNFNIPVSNPFPDGQCDLVVSMCGTGGTPDESAPFDSFMAIYKDAGNPFVCPCPTTAAVAAATVLDAADDTCRGHLGSSGPPHLVLEDMTPGCYTIRLGGWQGAKGTGLVNISCGPAYCGDNRRNKTEECDGTDEGICPGQACNPDCTCGAAVFCGATCHGGPTPGIPCTYLGTPQQSNCGNGGSCFGEVTGQEECDPDANFQLPLRADGCFQQSDCDDVTCKCLAFCGNNAVEGNERCDGTDDSSCPDQCTVGCTCPTFECGNLVLEPLNGEQCEVDADCLNLGGGNCRPAGDLLGGCTCACAAVQAPPEIIWEDSELSAFRHSRTLTMTVAYPTAAAPAGTSALRLELVDLQHPRPHNRPANPTPLFTTFDTLVNGVCSGATSSPNYNGHHCDNITGATDCLGPNANPLVTTDDGTCGSVFGCTAVGEENSCMRWVGPVVSFREKQGVLGLGTYKAGRLQCTPYYTNWTTLGRFSVFGAELIPSSEYKGQVFGSDCEGKESTCGNVSTAVTMKTRRSGDVAAPWNPPDTGDQPTGGDVGEVLNKFKGSPGSPSNIAALIFGNVPDPNTDVGGQEIGETVNAFKGLQYGFFGPCTCPSATVCGAVACSSTNTGPCGAGLCVITCQGGLNDGLPCRDFPPNAPADHCPGGTCPTNGFCRDRCGRCTPP